MQIPRVIHGVKCQFYKSLHEPKSWFGSELSHCRGVTFLFYLVSPKAELSTDQGHSPPAVCLALSILSGMSGRNSSHHRTGSAKLIQLNWSFPWRLMGIGPSHRGQKTVQIWAKLQNIFSQTSAKILMPLFSEYVCHKIQRNCKFKWGGISWKSKV